MQHEISLGSKNQNEAQSLPQILQVWRLEAVGLNTWRRNEYMKIMMNRSVDSKSDLPGFCVTAIPSPIYTVFSSPPLTGRF